MDYKLSTTLYGHRNDVKALGLLPDGSIVSTSRDKTAIIWKPNEFEGGYSAYLSLEGHKNFVNSLCVLEPTEKYPAGLIITGGTDAVVCGYNGNTTVPEPLFTFKPHSSNVCHLSPGLKPNTFLSSSWDCSTKLWDVDCWEKPLAHLKDHQLAVWASIQLRSGIIVTASADKSLNVYSATFELLRSLSGHTDCVRDVVAISDVEVYSCANDATIRRWNVLTGDCVNIVYGHPNFIYSIHMNAGVVASGGEDRCVKIWEGEKDQLLYLPAQSIWCSLVLPNKDVVIGSSDSCIRVFSQSSERYANPAELAKYDEQVSSMFAQSEKMIGGVKVSDLPGPETLAENGKTDGQTKIIREGNVAVCYSWSAAQQKWEKVGDVLGANENPNSGLGKTVFNGKEFDYVFNIDVENRPPLKLPYNKGEDPWHAAQRFIHDNDVSQHYLEQIANFIIKNSKQPESSRPDESTMPVQFSDPYTGGARYIPGRNLGTGNVPGREYTDPVPQLKSMPKQKEFTPHTEYVLFEKFNYDQVYDKLKEFNAIGYCLDEQILKLIMNLADVKAQPTCDIVNTYKDLLNSPPNLLLPIMDILRLTMRNPFMNATLCSNEYGYKLIEFVKRNLAPGVLLANKIMALKTICNMLIHSPGEHLLLNNTDGIVDAISAFVVESTLNKALQVAYSTALLNLSIMLIKVNRLGELIPIQLLVLKILQLSTDKEAQHRSLVALGTIIILHKEAVVHVEMPAVETIRQISMNSDSKIKLCANQILDLIQ